MLNDIQRDLIKNNLWVVNTAIKRLNLQGNEDYCQMGKLYLCQCTERFNEAKGVKFTTYAYKNVYLYLKRIRAKEISENNLYTDIDVDIAGANVVEVVQTCTTISKLPLNKTQKQILRMKANGYTLKETAKDLKCSISKVEQNLRKTKSKLKNLEKEN
jgi:RNA polymerase sigma factor (sigma-70 family)